jgi:hypothetical protein
MKLAAGVMPGWALFVSPLESGEAAQLGLEEERCVALDLSIAVVPKISSHQDICGLLCIKG